MSLERNITVPQGIVLTGDVLTTFHSSRVESFMRVANDTSISEQEILRRVTRDLFKELCFVSLSSETKTRGSNFHMLHHRATRGYMADHLPPELVADRRQKMNSPTRFDGIMLEKELVRRVFLYSLEPSENFLSRAFLEARINRYYLPLSPNFDTPHFNLVIPKDLAISDEFIDKVTGERRHRLEINKLELTTEEILQGGQLIIDSLGFSPKEEALKS